MDGSMSTIVHGREELPDCLCFFRNVRNLQTEWVKGQDKGESFSKVLILPAAGRIGVVVTCV